MAVYSDVSDDQLRDLLATYDIGRAVTLKGIAEGIENSNFLLVTTTGTFILTLYEKRVRQEDLPFFMDLLDHLARQGVPCPVPVPDRHGQVLSRVAGKTCAIVTFLQGMWPRKPAPHHCAEVGGALAALHKASTSFAQSRPNNLSATGWRPLFNKCAAYADDVAPGLAATIDAELDFLEARWPVNLPRGVIHADLFPDNIFFQDDRVSGLIDFYFACTDFFAYEIAICLNAWCFEVDGDFNVTKARVLLRAYRAGRACTADEIDALPILARGAALRFLLTRLYDWVHTPEGALGSRKSPLEYLHKLRFHQGVTWPGAYGLI